MTTRSEQGGRLGRFCAEAGELPGVAAGTLCWSCGELLGAKAEAGGPRVEVTTDVRFDQAGGPGLGEKGSESGSTLKVELPGFPHRLDVGAD